MNVLYQLKDILKNKKIQYRLTLKASDFRYKNLDSDKYKLAIETDYQLNCIKKDIACLQEASDILAKYVDPYTAGLDVENAPLIDYPDHEALMLECSNRKYHGWDD